MRVRWDALLTEGQLEKLQLLAEKKKKNGFTVMSIDEFVEESLTEAPKFGKFRGISDDKMKDFLRKVKDQELNDRERMQMPIVHNKNVHFVDESGNEIDINRLRKEITTRPRELLSQNKKMKKTSKEGNKNVFNIGLPALRGLAVDESTGEFLIVNTCPGAGSCMIDCYARKGGYVMYKDSSMSRSQRLNFLINDPVGFKDRLMTEIAAKKKTADKQGKILDIRWHDAGDFFSPEYMDMANDIANAFPDVEFYAYTKTADVMDNTAPNFNPRFSEGARKRDELKIDFKSQRSGRIFPLKLFNDLFSNEKDSTGRTKFKDSNAKEELKTRVAKEYNLDRDTILTDAEYAQRKSSLGDKDNSWNVVIVPGGSDSAANDNRVLNVINLWH